jgi:hypothetical protein
MRSLIAVAVFAFLGVGCGAEVEPAADDESPSEQQNADAGPSATRVGGAAQEAVNQRAKNSRHCGRICANQTRTSYVECNINCCRLWGGC